MGLLLTFIFSTIIISFICSFLESMLLSITGSHVALLIKNGEKAGPILRKMKKNINHPLSAILTLNTVANVAGSAGVGAQSYLVFGNEWIALVSGIMTIMILVFGEVIPKTIATIYWKKFAPFGAYAINGLIFILFPFVFLLEKISSIIAKKSHHGYITREELIVLAETSHTEGILSEKESRIMKNLLILNEIRTEEILTPRAIVFALQKDMTIKEAYESHEHIPYSRIPVYDNDLDSIQGIILRNELMKHYFTGENLKPVSDFMMHVYAVPDSKTISELLNEFIERKEHIFIVIDEYGGTAGIVTLEDAVETLLGEEIVDEFESVEDLRSFAVEKWKQKRKKYQRI